MDPIPATLQEFALAAAEATKKGTLEAHQEILLAEESKKKLVEGQPFDIVTYGNANKPDGTSLLDFSQQGTPAWRKVEELVDEMLMGQAPTLAIERPLNKLLPGFNLPIGSLIVGGTTGLIVGEIVDAVSPVRATDNPFGNFLLQGVVAMVVAQVGPALMSKQASGFAAAVIVTRALADLQLVQQFVGFVTGPFRRMGETTQGMNMGRHNNLEPFRGAQAPELLRRPADDSLAALIGNN